MEGRVVKDTRLNLKNLKIVGQRERFNYLPLRSRYSKYYYKSSWFTIFYGKILSCVIWNCLYVNRDNVVENRSRQRKSEEQRITNCIERFVCEIKSKLVFLFIKIIISYLIPLLTKQETSSNPTLTPPTMPMMTKYDSIWDSQEASMRISVVFWFV